MDKSVLDRTAQGPQTAGEKSAGGAGAAPAAPDKYAKVYCTKKQCFKYVEACLGNCRGKNTCKVIEKYR